MDHDERLAQLLSTGPIGARSPRDLFAGADDEFWLWANTEGYRSSSALQQVLPSMPRDDLQAKPIGSSGDNALILGFAVYRLYKELIETYLGPVAESGDILDFGVGWGRLLRFFLRETDPDRLWGADVNAHFIRTCRQTNRWSYFLENGVVPPMRLPNNQFGVIYSYSVFSHLGEEVHERWLAELARILRPGGLFIASTWHRGFIEWVERTRTDPNLTVHPDWRDNLSTIFQDTAGWLAKYDRGEFCFEPYDAAKHERAFVDGVPSHGETCIPERYVRDHWTRYFEFSEFIDDRRRCQQNVIVMKKR